MSGVTAPSSPGSAPETGPCTLAQRVTAFRKNHARTETVLFFMGGFCFDLLLLERIDSVPMLIHQGSYLVLLSLLLGVDHHFTVQGHDPVGLWGKVLHFRHELIHFLFGTLLNAFLVFYFKASSGLFAFLFLLVLCGVLLANEHPRFRKLGPIMRMALLSFATASFFSYLFPVVAGFLSPWLFLLAVLLSAGITYGLWRLYSRFTYDPQWTFQRAVVPGLGVQATLLLLYFLHVVPPVPLSLKWIGLYHDVQREGTLTRLFHQRPAWKLWEKGDQTFLARPGDAVHLFARIFAPSKFRDGLKIRWSYYDPKHGWTRTDAIPLVISGGQEEGWRGHAYKRNYAPGEWKVNVETDDGRDVGNIRFEIVADLGTEPRTFTEEVK